MTDALSLSELFDLVVERASRDGAKAERERIVNWLRGTPADAIMVLVGHVLPLQQTNDIVEALASAIEADPT